MTSKEKRNAAKASGSVHCHSALVTRIALFLNYLSRENFQKLIRDTKGRPLTSEGDLLKYMITQGYINAADAPSLKKTCLSFARAQKDTRFGSLCIQFEFLTQSNLNLALEEQKKLSTDGRTIFLGDLLVEAGMISQRQQKLVLRKQKMDLDFKVALVGFAPNTREIKEKDVTIYIPEDGLTAWMVKNKQFDPDMLLSDLKEIIERNGIIYGMADDITLAAFLASPQDPDERFELAKGLAPVPGKDARIFYLFDKDYLSPGSVENDGSIDYRNRGDIPFVRTDTVLAEKIPSKSGRDGVNVFGDVVEAPPPMDLDIICGKGVALSEDRLKAVATLDGYPKLSQEGTLSVSDAHVIRGDVDFTTGHVKFDKNVFITGAIKAGFRVEANDVVARAVDGGIIHARGDVSVANGITDGTIKAKGHVSAGFIHRSTIACLGNMEIDKEVVESDILLEGTFEMSRGKMYASSVAARGGARIYHIGSVKAVPSTITVGVSPYIASELRFINRKVEKSQTDFDTKTSEQETLKKSLEEIESTIERIQTAAVTDGGEGFPDLSGPEDQQAALKALRHEKQKLQAKIIKVGLDIRVAKEEIAHWINEKFEIKRQNKTNPPRPILDIRGRILAGTRVKGIHSSTLISRDLARVRLIEMSCASDHKDGKLSWEMVANRL